MRYYYVHKSSASKSFPSPERPRHTYNQWWAKLQLPLNYHTPLHIILSSRFQLVTILVKKALLHCFFNDSETQRFIDAARPRGDGVSSPLSSLKQPSFSIQGGHFTRIQVQQVTILLGSDKLLKCIRVTFQLCNQLLFFSNLQRQSLFKTAGTSL